MAIELTKRADEWSVGGAKSPKIEPPQPPQPGIAIGKGCAIEGQLTLTEPALINGRVSGTISSSARLTIGPEGVIASEISGSQVVVYGRVEGDIECSERLELCAGSCVTGNITTPALIIQDGVVFEGVCSMLSVPSSTSDDGRTGAKITRLKSNC